MDVKVTSYWLARPDGLMVARQCEIGLNVYPMFNYGISISIVLLLFITESFAQDYNGMCTFWTDLWWLIWMIMENFL